jgi:hypothetical protein
MDVANPDGPYASEAICGRWARGLRVREKLDISG